MQQRTAGQTQTQSPTHAIWHVVACSTLSICDAQMLVVLRLFHNSFIWFFLVILSKQLWLKSEFQCVCMGEKYTGSERHIIRKRKRLKSSECGWPSSDSDHCCLYRSIFRILLIIFGYNHICAGNIKKRGFTQMETAWLALFGTLVVASEVRLPSLVIIWQSIFTHFSYCPFCLKLRKINEFCYLFHWIWQHHFFLKAELTIC